MNQFNRYTKLHRINSVKAFDWQNNMFRRTLPKRAFHNELTKNILFSMQRILSIGFSSVDNIKKYFKF